MLVIVFQGMSVNLQSHIGTGMTCPFSRVGYAYSCLQLQADWRMPELVRVYLRQTVFLCKACQPRPYRVRVKIITKLCGWEKYSHNFHIPLVTVLKNPFGVVCPIFVQHFHNAVVHVQPTLSRNSFTTVLNVSAASVKHKMLTNMYAAFNKINGSF